MSLLSPLDRWLAPAPKPERVAWLRGATFAHRGLHGPGVPENSLSAAMAAIDRGLGIECDVHKSGDGQPMVFHDDSLDRLTGLSGRIGERTAADLGTIALLGSTDTIPTLRALLDRIAGQVPLLIEIKAPEDGRSGALCLAVRRVLEGYRGPHAVMSFDARIVRWFLLHSPHTVRGLAKRLGVTKPAITRALDTMGKMALVSRRRDDVDRRNVIVQRTVKGALYVERLGDLVVARSKDLPR